MADSTGYSTRVLRSVFGCFYPLITSNAFFEITSEINRVFMRNIGIFICSLFEKKINEVCLFLSEIDTKVTYRNMSGSTGYFTRFLCSVFVCFYPLISSKVFFGITAEINRVFLSGT